MGTILAVLFVVFSSQSKVEYNIILRLFPWVPTEYIIVIFYLNSIGST